MTIPELIAQLEQLLQLLRAIAGAQQPPAAAAARAR